MPARTEVPADRWGAFLAAFSRRNENRPVRLETLPTPGGGACLAAGQPLLGIEFDPEGSEAPSIVITLGGIEPGAPDFRHIVKDPTRVVVEEDDAGLGVRVEIESRDEGCTGLVFEPAAAARAEAPEAATSGRA